jgi:hypothetical protein
MRKVVAMEILLDLLEGSYMRAMELSMLENHKF